MIDQFGGEDDHIVILFISFLACIQTQPYEINLILHEKSWRSHRPPLDQVPMPQKFQCCFLFYSKKSE